MPPLKDRTSITMETELLQYLQERARNQHSSVSQVITDIVLDEQAEYLIAEKRWRPDVHSSMSSAVRASQQPFDTGEQAGAYRVGTVAEIARRRQRQRDHGERTGVASSLPGPDGDHHIQHTVADLMSREGGPSLEEGNAHREAVREEMLNEVDPDGLLRGWGRQAKVEKWVSNPLELLQDALWCRKAKKEIFPYSNPHQRGIGFSIPPDDMCVMIKLDALHAWKGEKLYEEDVLSMTVGGVIDAFFDPEARKGMFGEDPMNLGSLRHMTVKEEEGEADGDLNLEDVFRDEEIEQGVEALKQRGTLVETSREDPVLGTAFDELPPGGVPSDDLGDGADVPDP